MRCESPQNISACDWMEETQENKNTKSVYTSQRKLQDWNNTPHTKTTSTLLHNALLAEKARPRLSASSADACCQQLKTVYAEDIKENNNKPFKVVYTERHSTSSKKEKRQDLINTCSVENRLRWNPVCQLNPLSKNKTPRAWRVLKNGHPHVKFLSSLFWLSLLLRLSLSLSNLLSWVKWLNFYHTTTIYYLQTFW